jgi:tetratricopeptide (TPR) repeat protein
VLPGVTRIRPIRPGPASTLSSVPSSASAPASEAKAANPAAAAVLARQDIAVARQTGDTRYWGRAQAALLPWWDRADAPADIAVLQATVQQGRHEFEASRRILTAALARAPMHAQGWLNLAALERLSARYAESLKACEAVARAGQALYAQACRFETQSLQGQNLSAARGLQALIAQTADAGQQSWLYSLLAESLERAGQARAAGEAYQRSLRLDPDPDLYTAIAYSDLLLRTGKPSQALAALAKLPETDAVVLRRAAAWKRLGDARWVAAREQLKAYSAELVRRGDDPALHGRELALAALWLDGDGPAALALAQRNLLLQREPVDWWVALQSAQLAKDASAIADIRARLAAAGLQDTRLAAVPGEAAAPGKAAQ